MPEVPLPDPRAYGPAAPGDVFNTLTAAILSGHVAASGDLARAVDIDLQQGGLGVARALKVAPSPLAWRTLWDFACATAESPPGHDEALTARLFALPLIIVAGARAKSVIPGVLPDIGEVTALLNDKGVLGATRNFGLSNALTALEEVESIMPAEVRAWTTGGLHAIPRDFEGAPIAVEPGRERVHLRFLVGAGLTPSGAASFLETASNIGAWGMPLTRLLATQLRQPGVDLLPMPRPPVALLAASHAGRRAQLGAAFDLFLSNAIRRFRSSVGDPSTVVSAHALAGGGGEVRVSLSSAFDESMLDGYSWPLHPVDDLGEIGRDIAVRLADCRIGDVQWIAKVLPDDLGGGMQFLNARGVAAVGGVH